jgi:hypothetical protein
VDSYLYVNETLLIFPCVKLYHLITGPRDGPSSQFISAHRCIGSENTPNCVPTLAPTHPAAASLPPPILPRRNPCPHPSCHDLPACIHHATTSLPPPILPRVQLTLQFQFLLGVEHSQKLRCGCT